MGFKRHSERGTTLVEVLIASAVAGIALTSIFGLMTGQIAGYRRQEQQSETTQNARVSMDFMIKHVSRASFGLPGEDMLPATIRNNVASGASDSTCAGTDVLEVRYRDPAGYWKYASASSTAISMSNPNRLNMPVGSSGVDPGWNKNQYFFVYAGLGTFGTARAATARAPSSPPNTGAPSFVQSLVAANSADMGLAGVSTPANLAIAEVSKMQVARFRVTCITPAHPVLVFEDDTLDSSGAVVSQPLAMDIEDLQVAYMVDLNEDDSIADTEAFNTPDAAVDPKMPTALAKRLHVKGVRISIVARSGTEISGVNDPAPVLEDHTPSASTKYTRRVLREVITFDNRNTSQPLIFNYVSNGDL